MGGRHLYSEHKRQCELLALLQDFDRHSKIYPEIIRSRLVKQQGDEFTVTGELERKQQFVPAVFDVQQDAHYREVAPGKWICRASTTEIREVQDAGSAKEQDYPPGEGLGLLWRMDAFWSLEASGNGVLAECRTISLSRRIPSRHGLDDQAIYSECAERISDVYAAEHT